MAMPINNITFMIAFSQPSGSSVVNNTTKRMLNDQQEPPTKKKKSESVQGGYLYSYRFVNYTSMFDFIFRSRM